MRGTKLHLRTKCPKRRSRRSPEEPKWITLPRGLSTGIDIVISQKHTHSNKLCVFKLLLKATGNSIFILLRTAPKQHYGQQFHFRAQQ